MVSSGIIIYEEHNVTNLLFQKKAYWEISQQNG